MVEFSLTLLAVVIAFAIKRDGLTLVLLGAWILSLTAALALTASYLPAAAAIVDTIIALGALTLWTEHGSQRARIVGMISLAKLFIHFGLSANMGFGNWWLYSLSINCMFVLQCLVAGGVFRGVDNFIDNISPRHRDNHAPSHKREG